MNLSIKVDSKVGRNHSGLLEKRENAEGTLYLNYLSNYIVGIVSKYAQSDS